MFGECIWLEHFMCFTNYWCRSFKSSFRCFTRGSTLTDRRTSSLWSDSSKSAFRCWQKKPPNGRLCDPLIDGCNNFRQEAGMNPSKEAPCLKHHDIGRMISITSFYRARLKRLHHRGSKDNWFSCRLTSSPTGQKKRTDDPCPLMQQIAQFQWHHMQQELGNQVQKY